MSAALGKAAVNGWLDCFEQQIINNLVRHLLDEQSIPKTAIPRPIRGLPARCLCNPYMPFHRSMYWFGLLFERQLDRCLRKLLQSGDRFIDVGANFGHLTMLAAALVGSNGSVVAIEANSELAENLKQFACSEHASQVRVLAVAAGAEESEGVLHLAPSHIGASTLRSVDGDADPQKFLRTVTVPIHRLDNLIPCKYAAGNTIVKIDVEGFENQVLEGMRGIFSVGVDAVFVEVSPSWLGRDGVNKMFEFMAGYGLHARVLAERSKAGPLPMIQASEITDQENVVFIGDKVTKILNG
jgi:FkbM family methyltransferase